MSRHEITERTKKINAYNDDNKLTELNVLINKLKTYEKTRHLMMWHDGSSVRAHSHLLMMISSFYDQACHLTDTEFKERPGGDINAQFMVKKGEICILAHCPSSNQQILYFEERYEDLVVKASLKVNGDLNINDTLRVFTGDKPAAQFEARQQKGGNYCCFVCRIHSEAACGNNHSNKLTLQTLSERTDIIDMSQNARSK